MTGILFDVPPLAEEAKELINSYKVADRCGNMAAE